MTGGDLQVVDFGRLDAETDPNLLSYFLITGTVTEAADGAQLVIGRKGAGKTALFKHLAATLPTRVIELDLVDYVFELHKGLTDVGLSAERAYTSSWRLLIYAAIFGELRTDMGRRNRVYGDNALRSIGLSSNASGLRRMAEWLKRVRRVDLPSVEGVAGLGGLELAEPEVGALSIETATAIDTLEKLLKDQLGRTPVTVLLDRLDDAWTGSADSAHLIGGAVRATRDVSIAMAQSGPAPVVTFLRTDLWERLSFNDKNKMSQDIIYLDWQPDQLAEVVDLRIRTSLGTSPGTGWSKVFTQAEMRQRASARTYILKRTLGRPRDIIAFSIFARRAALTSGHSQIEAGDIYEAEQRYSKHVLDELRDEVERHVRDFTLVVNSLKSLRNRSFTIPEWTAATAANGLNEADAKVALGQLFEASAVGIHRAGGAAGGSGTTYRYQDRHLRSLDDATHQVHLALVRELGLRDT